MTVVTVGTERFDALIAEVDRLVDCGMLTGDVLCQIGVGRYKPVHVPFIRYDRALAEIRDLLLSERKARPGDLVVLLSATPIRHRGQADTIKFLRIERPAASR